MRYKKNMDDTGNVDNRVLYIYGAAESGILLYKRSALVKKYTRVFFVDRNPELAGSNICDVKVILPEEVVCGDMIITNREFSQVWMYYFSNYDDVKILGVYDSEEDTVFDYEHACLNKNQTFYNEKAQKWFRNHTVRKKKNIDKYINNRNIIEAIGTVNIELSNICNYSDIHRLCPVNRNKSKVIMPLKKIRSIIEELCEHGYDGALGFYIYNEPLIDPRLFYVIDYAKKKLPQSSIEITSNGFYFNQQMLAELEEIGCDRVCVSAYGKEEFYRLMQYSSKIAYIVYYAQLDDRLNNYIDAEQSKNNFPCSSFIDFVGVSCSGELYLCCMDFERRFQLGNVFEEGLYKILNKNIIKNYTDNLLAGNRNICNLCKNCDMVF